jgi:hypothetical protein
MTFKIGENMKLYTSFALILFLSSFMSTSCSTGSVKPSASMTANGAIHNMAPRRFEKHMLNSAGFQTMNEFIRPDTRSRMDEEPVGDTDGSYDPSTVDSSSASSDQSQPEAAGEAQPEEPQTSAPAVEEPAPSAASDSGKFSWARRSFGDAVKADPGANGVIIFYADENYYDLDKLTAFVETGRNTLAKQSSIEPAQIQVVFGGYRSVPQVELWIVPEGSEMPELKPDERPKPSGQEN